MADNARGQVYKGLSVFEFALEDSSETRYGMVEKRGFGWNVSADTVPVRGDQDFWPRNGGSATGNMEITIPNADLEARGTQLIPGITIYDIVCKLYGAGVNHGVYYAQLDIDEAVVSAVGGNVDNHGTDVENGSATIIPMLPYDASPSDDLYTWSVWEEEEA